MKNSLGHPWCLSGKRIHLPMQEAQVWSLGQEDCPEEGNGSPLQCSCLGSPVDRLSNDDNQWVWEGESVHLMLLDIHSMRVNLVTWSIILLEIDSSFVLDFYVYLIYLENILMHGVNWGSKWKRIQRSCYVLSKARAFPVVCDASFSICFVFTYRVDSLISPVDSHTTTTLI